MANPADESFAFLKSIHQALDFAGPRSLGIVDAMFDEMSKEQQTFVASFLKKTTIKLREARKIATIAPPSSSKKETVHMAGMSLLLLLMLLCVWLIFSHCAVALLVSVCVQSKMKFTSSLRVCGRRN